MKEAKIHDLTLSPLAFMAPSVIHNHLVQFEEQAKCQSIFAIFISMFSLAQPAENKDYSELYRDFTEMSV